MDRYSIETLDIQGYDAPVPNSYWTIGSHTLLIMLPGLGYTNAMPLMFYLHEIAINRGYDVLQVDYDYRGVPRETPAEEWATRMIADVQPTIDSALENGDYRNVILAGKSIGTRVMTTLLANGFDRSTAYMWLTPLFVVDQVKQTALDHGPAVAVFGDADYAVKDVELDSMQQAGVHMITMPGGDHSMMVAGSVSQSISKLAYVMHELEAWLIQAVETTGDTE